MGLVGLLTGRKGCNRGTRKDLGRGSKEGPCALNGSLHLDRLDSSLPHSVPSFVLTDLVDEVLEADVAVDPPRDDGGRLRARRLAANLVLHVGRHRPHLRRDEPRLHGPH